MSRFAQGRFVTWLMLGAIMCNMVAGSTTNRLLVLLPLDLRSKYPEGIIFHLSPIGFKPLSGSLQGRAILAEPSSACGKVQDAHSDQQSIFLLADDSSCLESIKSKNIALSGSHAGIIKYSQENSLYDKEIELVHIPIVELLPNIYDDIVLYMVTHTEQQFVFQLDFNVRSNNLDICLQLWFSPIEEKSYQFLFSMEQFIRQQSTILSFSPNYVLQSQKELKIYLGCLSSGRYCPTQIQYEGLNEGKNIVVETLRQIIIWKMSPDLWWKYIHEYYTLCLKDGGDTPIFMRESQLAYCSETAMFTSGINMSQYRREANMSFLGARSQIDDNTYLQEQRQSYIREQITSHPQVMLNYKPYDMDSQALQARICLLETPPSQLCVQSKKSSYTSLNFFLAVGSILLVVVVLLTLYRIYIEWKMKKEIKTEVDKTLQQYYRYMDTFEGEDGQVVDPKSRNRNTKDNARTNDEVEMVPRRAVSP